VRGLTVLNARVRLHPLAVIGALIAVLTGAGWETAAMLLALFFHEGSHLLAAWAMGITVRAIDLMPFGAAIRMENPYVLSAAQLGVVSLAGPFANAVVVLLSAALAWWGVLSGMPAYLLIRANLMLCLFNLLPALPLDGGRAMYALLSRHMPPRRATNLLVFAGRAVALALVLAAVAGYIKTRRVNLTLLICAVFLVAAGFREKEDANEGVLRTITDARRGNDLPGRVRIVPVTAEMSALDAMRKLRPRAETLFAVYEQGKFSGFLDSASIRTAVLEASIAPGEIKIGYIQKKQRPRAGAVRFPA